MKSVAYIARMFKGYKIKDEEVRKDSKMGITCYRFMLLSRFSACEYIIYIWDDCEHETAIIRREQAQAKELVQALQALPRYEERR